MKALRVFAALLAIFAAPVSHADQAVECALSIYQVDTLNRTDVLLFADTAVFVEGMRSSGFPVVFSLGVEFTDIDTAACEFNTHVITLNTPAATYSRSYRVEYGLPARLTDIRGKGECRYVLEMVPVGPLAVDTSACPFEHTRENVFRIAPSANMNLYFVRNSLAEYYWTSVRDLLEAQFQQFSSLFSFSLPGKYNVYLCPCPIPSVIWDSRFGTAVDPTSSTVHTLYTSGFNSADPFVVMHAAIMRHWGYAPPIISEGAANYFSFTILDMREMFSNGEVPPLEDMLDTYRFLEADPMIADRVSGSLVRYLLDRYSLRAFSGMYEAADDLNLASVLERTYGTTVDQLESEWRTYVDTVTVKVTDLGVAAEKAEVMRNFPRMLKYSREMLPIAKTARDTLEHYGRFERACFFNGDYYGAAAAQRVQLLVDSTSARHWVGLAGYQMMSGYYDSAWIGLQRANDLDSASSLPKFNVGLYHLVCGDTAAARQALLSIAGPPGAASGNSESRILLAQIISVSEDSVTRDQAEPYYQQAINELEKVLSMGAPNPGAMMWLGIAWLGMGDPGLAEDYLQAALFLETRPFYQGMIHLWLGKLEDVSSERELALHHYGAVLEGQSAVYHQQEARRYVERPFENRVQRR